MVRVIHLEFNIKLFMFKFRNNRVLIEVKTVENWVNVISSLGYPVAVSVVTIGFVFKLVMDEREENRQREERLMDMVRSTIDNNTKAIQDLKSVMESRGV